MIWPEKLYQFTKVQGAVTTYTFLREITAFPSAYRTAIYVSNYNQSYHVSETDIVRYHTSLESCYEAWIDSIEKFKQKVIKQFENKCGADYYEISIEKIKAQIQQVRYEMDKNV